MDGMYDVRAHSDGPNLLIALLWSSLQPSRTSFKLMFFVSAACIFTVSVQSRQRCLHTRAGGLLQQGAPKNQEPPMYAKCAARRQADSVSSQLVNKLEHLAAQEPDLSPGKAVETWTELKGGVNVGQVDRNTTAYWCWCASVGYKYQFIRTEILLYVRVVSTTARCLQVVTELTSHWREDHSKT